MKVFIANFGQENYEWPVCRARGTVATMNDVEAQALWSAGRREDYILNRMAGKTVAGLAPTRAVAARWYNLMTIVAETDGDIWIHRDGDQLFWTRSTSQPPTFEPKTEPVGRKREVIICHKPCEDWRDCTTTGDQLLWNSLHPKARDFLSTEATLQKLGPDNAAYAIALINGEDLREWHDLAVWRDKDSAASTSYSPGRNYSGFEFASWRMADTAERTAQHANGQEVTVKQKNKDVRFSSKQALIEHIMALIQMQEGLCALTGLPLERDEKSGDREMICSLDRIDSDGHYEAGNLQVVCRFANRWKSDGDDQEFQRLISVIRHGAPSDFQ